MGTESLSLGTLGSTGLAFLATTSPTGGGTWGRAFVSEDVSSSVLKKRQDLRDTDCPASPWAHTPLRADTQRVTRHLSHETGSTYWKER